MNHSGSALCRRLLVACFCIGLEATVPARMLRLQLDARNAFYPDGYTGVSDAYIDSRAADRNFGGDWEFTIGGMPDGAVRRGLLRWEVTGLAPLFTDPRYEVVSVELRLGLWYNWKIPDQAFDVYRLLPANAGWVEGGRQDDASPGLVTWNAVASGARPWAGSPGCGTPGTDYAPVPLACVQADRQSHMLPRYLPPVELPVAHVRDWALHPEQNAGLLIRRREEPTAAGEQYVFFISSQHRRTDFGWDRHHPELVVTYIDHEDARTAQAGEWVSSGRSGHVVVIPDEVQGAERYAAEEFIDHIKAMSSCELTLVREGYYRPELGWPISIGRTRMSQEVLSDRQLRRLGDEGYITARQGEAFFICGGRRRGSLYGVYDVLEDLGVRWLAPKATLMPSAASIAIPRREVRTVPPVFYRDQLWNNGSDPAWRARQRLNGEYARLPEAMGGSTQVHLGCHSYHALVPLDVLKAHPDWAALKEDGKRSPGTEESVELCNTHPELREFIVERVRRDLRENPAIEQVWVSQDDGRLSGCFCAVCTRERVRYGGRDLPDAPAEPADSAAATARLKDYCWAANTIALANTVARAIRTEFPRVQVKTLAYSYTWSAPRLRVEPNVVVVICGPAGDWFLPYTHNEKTREWREALREWTGLGGTVQTYLYGGSNYGYWWPFPTWLTMCRNTQAAFSDGVRAMYRQGTAAGYGAEFTELRAYLSARMAFRPERDIMTELREFTDGYYGPGGEPIRAYLLWFDGYLHRNQIHGDHYWGNSRGWAEYMTPELTAQADVYLQEAVRRTAGQAPFELRARAARLPILLMQVLLGQRETPLIDAAEMILVDAAESDRLVAAAREFNDTLRECGYDRWNELTAYDPDHNVLTAFARRHPVLCLQNPDTCVYVVPSLGGRIVRWDVNALGGNLIHLPAGRGGNYPYAGGYEEYSQFERNSPGAAADFAVVGTPEPRRLVLRAALPNGLEMTRELELAATGCRLDLRSTCTNRSDRPVAVTLRSHPEFDIERCRNAVLRYTAADGKGVTQELLGPGRRVGEVTIAVDRTAGGTWELADPKAGWALVNHFDPSQVATLYCFYGEDDGCINLELWGKPSVLEPGQAARLTQAFSLRLADPGR